MADEGAGIVGLGVLVLGLARLRHGWEEIEETRRRSELSRCVSILAGEDEIKAKEKYEIRVLFIDAIPRPPGFYL